MKKLLLLIPVLGGVLAVPLLALLALVGTGNVAAACEPAVDSASPGALAPRPGTDPSSAGRATVRPQEPASTPALTPNAHVAAPRHGNRQVIAVTTRSRPPAPSALPAKPTAPTQAATPGASVLLLACQQVTAPPAGDLARRALAWALAHIGDAYVAGAHGPHAWDCSTFTYTAYRQAGLNWPMQISYEQYLDRRHVQLVPLSQAQPGDLLFFDTGQGNSWYNPVTHVAMVVDPVAGTMVNAANPSAGVTISNYKTSSYYQDHPPVAAPDPQGVPYPNAESVAGRVVP